MYFGVLNFAVR